MTITEIRELEIPEGKYKWALKLFRDEIFPGGVLDAYYDDPQIIESLKAAFGALMCLQEHNYSTMEWWEDAVKRGKIEGRAQAISDVLEVVDQVMEWDWKVELKRRIEALGGGK